MPEQLFRKDKGIMIIMDGNMRNGITREQISTLWEKRKVSSVIRTKKDIISHGLTIFATTGFLIILPSIISEYYGILFFTILILLLYSLYSVILFFQFSRKKKTSTNSEMGFSQILSIGIMSWENINTITVSMVLFLCGIIILFIGLQNKINLSILIYNFSLLTITIMTSAFLTPFRIKEELEGKRENENQKIKQLAIPVSAIAMQIIYIYYKFIGSKLNTGVDWFTVMMGLIVIGCSMAIVFMTSYKVFKDIIFIKNDFHKTIKWN